VRLKIGSQATKLLYLLLLTDGLFIAMHVLIFSTGWGEKLGIPDLTLYLVQKDRGFAEFFQYTKEFWCIVLLGCVVVKQRALPYLSWLLLFAYLLLDDAIGLHEKLGASLSLKLGFAPMFRLRSIDFGEVLVSAVMGLVLFSLIVISYRLGDDLFRKASKILIALLLALIFFGVFLDLIHIMAPKRFNDFLAIVEDGGEMLVMSAIAAFAFALSEQVPPSEPYKKHDRRQS
jgi:hypothetical protein